MDKLKVYIMHYTPLVDRKKKIDKIIKDYNLNAQYINEFDRESLDLDSKIFQVNSFAWFKQLILIKDILIKNQFQNINNKKNSFSYEINKFIKLKLGIIHFPKWLRPRKLSPAEISLTLKHFTALKEISKSNYPALICEDDIIFKKNSLEELENAFELCKKDFDFINIGEGGNLPFFEFDKPLKSNNRFIELNIPRSNTTNAYMVNPNTAKTLSENLIPTIMPVDWQLQYLLIKYKYKVLWANPPIFGHGSKNEYKSSIR